jgi:hypothetical protein
LALHRQEDWDEAMLLCAITAQAVSKGHHAVARALFNLDSGIIDKVGRLDFSED